MANPVAASQVLEAALEQMDNFLATPPLELKGTLNMTLNTKCNGSSGEVSTKSLLSSQHSETQLCSTDLAHVKHLLEELGSFIKRSDANDNFSFKEGDIEVPILEDVHNWTEKMIMKTPSTHPDSSGIQKLRQLESEKKNLILQISVLNDQVEVQTDKIRELENLLEDKKEQLRLTEHNLHEEIQTRLTLEREKSELITEISSLKLRLTASERDRKDSDERFWKTKRELQGVYDRPSIADFTSDQSIHKFKSSQNGSMVLSDEKSLEVDRLKVALEASVASNDEKDKIIEDLRVALVKSKKLQDFLLSDHLQKPSNVSLKDVQNSDAEIVKDPILSASSESTSPLRVHSQPHGKLKSKPPSGQRGLLTQTSVNENEIHGNKSAPSLTSGHTVNSDCNSTCSVQSVYKSNSLENVHKAASHSSPPKNSYGTIPRQAGSQVLENIQERLQNLERNATLPVAVSSREICQSPAPSVASKKQERKEQQKEATRSSRNKSSGVSFGKGFFKLRSGKRSSSAPQLAPFESVTIPIEERQVSSASPTPQPTMQPFFIKPEKERNRGLLKLFTKWKRSGSQNIEKIEGDFRRGGIRSTAGPRLGWSRDVSFDPDIPFTNWSNDFVTEWFHRIGLSMYMCECRRWKCNGEQLLNASSSEIEKELNIKNPLHKKKLILNLQRYKSDALPQSINDMDYHWVVRWLDDIGLPQYKDSFSEARVDGRVLHYLTVEDLLILKVTNQLHHISIKRGIQILREKNFDAQCLIRRSAPDEDKNYRPEYVALWTNHRVMEWLRTVDLSEYAPNLRGSGVHGALMVYETKFNTDLFATLLNIAPNKTLLRRHLATHFKAVVGADFIQAKRDLETDQLYIPLTPNVKIKYVRKPQFALIKRKSKGDSESEEFVCPMDIPVGAVPPCMNGEKLIVRRNSDPTHAEKSLLEENDQRTNAETGSVSKDITCLADLLQGKKLLENAPTTNV